MSTENNTEEPKKKPIEELILSKPITPEIVNKLFDVYKEDWEKYSAEMTEILDQSILNKIKDIKVLVDRIDTQPSCENCFDIKEQLLNDEKKKIFCMWLFKSHILCVNASERIVGRKIEHDLPVMFKIYLNKNLANRINSITNITSKIEQYNKAVDMVLKDFKSYLGDKEFFFKRIDAATVESDFDSVQVCLGFNTYYTEQEHKYIKEFVKEVITDEKKSEESLDQSEEGFFKITGAILIAIWLLYDLIKQIKGKVSDKQKKEYIKSDEFKRFSKSAYNFAQKCIEYQNYLIHNINSKMKKEYGIDYDFSKWLYDGYTIEKLLKNNIGPSIKTLKKGDNIIECEIMVYQMDDVIGNDDIINTYFSDNDAKFDTALHDLSNEWLKKNATKELFYDNKEIIKYCGEYSTTKLYCELFPLTLTITDK